MRQRRKRRCTCSHPRDACAYCPKPPRPYYVLTPAMNGPVAFWLEGGLGPELRRIHEEELRRG